MQHMRGWWRRRARWVVPAVLVVAWAAGSAEAQTGSAPAPAASSAAPALGARVTLANGVVVLVAERPALPIVNVQVAVGAGAVADPPDRAGLANLTALLVTRGTRSRTALEIDRAIEFAGGSLESEGGRDTSTVTLAVLRRDLDLGLDLLADVLVRPAFVESEVDRKRAEVVGAIRQSAQEPDTVAARALRRLAFPGHPYGQPVAGTEESVGRITRDEVVAFYEAHYRPETTLVAVVGAVTAAEVEAALGKRLGVWSAARNPAPPPALAAVRAPHGTETIQRDITQAAAFLGLSTVGRAHPDYYALSVAGHALGGGSSSRLYTRIREERGLAYSVFSDYIPGRFGGLFLVGFQSENGRVREVLALVREELVRLRRERLGDEELAQAKGYLVGSFPLRMDTNAKVTSLLLGVEYFGLGLDYPARYRRAIERVTADDVLRAVRTHWDPDAMSLAVVANLRDAGLATP
jgi:zinc protease